MFIAMLIVALSGLDFGATHYEVDLYHSSISFTISHMVVSKVRGGFTDFSVTIMENEQDLTQSTVSATIKTTSINTANETRDKHLRSADFFDVEKFPEITFQSKRFAKEGDNFAVIGTLTMHGVSKEVTIPFTVVGKVADPMGGVRMGVEGFTLLDRKDFGLNYNKALDKGSFVLGDQVKVEILLEMKSKTAAK